MLAFAALLALLFAGNWVWAGDAIQVGEFAFALLLVAACALALTLADRSAIRPGPPAAPARLRLSTVPDLCVGALLVPVGVAASLFGLAFGHFALYFGVAVLVLACARLANEVRLQRKTRRRLEESQLTARERAAQR
jgi:hypothetical protein